MQEGEGRGRSVRDYGPWTSGGKGQATSAKPARPNNHISYSLSALPASSFPYPAPKALRPSQHSHPVTLPLPKPASVSCLLAPLPKSVPRCRPCTACASLQSRPAHSENTSSPSGACPSSGDLRRDLASSASLCQPRLAITTCPLLILLEKRPITSCPSNCTYSPSATQMRKTKI